MARLDGIPPRLLASAYAIVLCIATFALGAPGGGVLALPGALLAALVAVASLARLAPKGSGFIAAAIAIALYIGTAAIAFPTTEERIAAGVAAVLSFLLIAGIGEVFTSRLHVLVADLQQSDSLVEELTTRDSLTGSVKAHYATQLLGDEVVRARRYQRAVTVAVFGVPDVDDLAQEMDVEDVFARVGRFLNEKLRKTDKVAFLLSPPRFLCILPETELAGSVVVAERLVEEIRGFTGAQFACGLAAYPDDAVDSDALVDEAQYAFEFAILAGTATAHRDVTHPPAEAVPAA